jgi:hypothetical protein
VPHSKTQMVVIAGTAPAVFDAVEAALSSIARINQANASAGYLAGTTGISVFSMGERIQVWISPEPQGTAVTVRSRCRLWSQVFDWGRNRRNIRRLLDAANATPSSGSASLIPPRPRSL